MSSGQWHQDTRVQNRELGVALQSKIIMFLRGLEYFSFGLWLLGLERHLAAIIIALLLICISITYYLVQLLTCALREKPCLIPILLHSTSFNLHWLRRLRLGLWYMG